MHNEPASTEVMVDGGVRRRPGPSLRRSDGLEGMGRISGEIVSPGSTSVCVAIGRRIYALIGVGVDASDANARL